MISDSRSVKISCSVCNKGVDESVTMQSGIILVALMHHDMSDLGSLFLIKINPKEGTNNFCSGDVTVVPVFKGHVFGNAGLCSRGTRVPQATNFCLWATGKTYFFHLSLSAGFHG